MKLSTLKKCATGLSISILLLTGSSIATAKGHNWQEEPLHKQEQELFVMDTKFRVELAKEQKSNAQEKNLLLKPASAAVVVKPLVIKPAEIKPAKAIITLPKLAAKKSIKGLVQAKRTIPTNLKMVMAESIVAEPIRKQDSSTTNENTLEISSGNTIKYSRLIPVKATAYTAAAEENGSWGAFDYYGNPLKLGTIAVDPDIIPMGSTVFITGYAFDGLPAQGMIAKATDMGGRIKGKRVDIFMPSSKADATKFGMQDVKIYIIK
jgi:3D (Asp-Asp-Asp) domain-containing protein